MNTAHRQSPTRRIPNARLALPTSLACLQLPCPFGALPADHLAATQRGVNAEIVDLTTTLTLVGVLEPAPEQVSRDAQVRSSNLLSGSSSEALFDLGTPSDRVNPISYPNI